MAARYRARVPRYDVRLVGRGSHEAGERQVPGGVTQLSSVANAPTFGSGCRRTTSGAWPRLFRRGERRTPRGTPTRMSRTRSEPRTYPERYLSRARHDVGAWNDQAPLRGEVPAANMVATARGGKVSHSPHTGEIACGGLIAGDDQGHAGTSNCIGRPVFGTSSPEERWGTGFMITSSAAPMLGPGSFGHHGAQGGLAFGDIDRRTSFAYLNNRMNFPPRNPNAIVEVLSDCISGRVRP